MANLHSEIESLKERVDRLERVRSTRGRTNQAGAAAYLGKSREFLRLAQLRGEGPRRGADGSYHYDDLDAWSEANPENSAA
jgi:hypothetical protein